MKKNKEKKSNKQSNKTDVIRSLAFYGDSEGSEIYAIDVAQMSLAATIPTGLGPYPVDEIVKGKTLYAITRKEEYVTVIDVPTLTQQGRIQLQHKPRSAQGNGNGLAIVSGANKPLTSIIDIQTQTVRNPPLGANITGTIEDFGGQLASGHERWLADNRRFWQFDRISRKISVYDSADNSLVWSVNSPTSIHHLIEDKFNLSLWYAICEGNPKAVIPASIMIIEEGRNGFEVTANVFLPTINRSFGSHHIDRHPDGKYFYIGSSEGTTFVFDKDTQQIISQIQTGKGCGHTRFTADGNLAVVVNHTDKFVSVIDARSHQLIQNIEITQSTPQTAPRNRTQGHTTDIKGNKFYVMASLDAVFYEIDLTTLEISRSCALPPTNSLGVKPFPMQGVFVEG